MQEKKQFKEEISIKYLLIFYAYKFLYVRYHIFGIVKAREVIAIRNGDIGIGSAKPAYGAYRVDFVRADGYIVRTVGRYERVHVVVDVFHGKTGKMLVQEVYHVCAFLP